MKFKFMVDLIPFQTLKSLTHIFKAGKMGTKFKMATVLRE